jgi:hypothetical protein
MQYRNDEDGSDVARVCQPRKLLGLRCPRACKRSAAFTPLKGPNARQFPITNPRPDAARPDSSLAFAIPMQGKTMDRSGNSELVTLRNGGSAPALRRKTVDIQGNSEFPYSPFRTTRSALQNIGQKCSILCLERFTLTFHGAGKLLAEFKNRPL